ncbi:hypothetical protein D3C80_1900100 [compost metagenome]
MISVRLLNLEQCVDYPKDLNEVGWCTIHMFTKKKINVNISNFNFSEAEYSLAKLSEERVLCSMLFTFHSLGDIKH